MSKNTFPTHVRIVRGAGKISFPMEMIIDAYQRKLISSEDYLNIDLATKTLLFLIPNNVSVTLKEWVELVVRHYDNARIKLMCESIVRVDGVIAGMTQIAE